jgi:AcrR family transcriptional regulator
VTSYRLADRKVTSMAEQAGMADRIADLALQRFRVDGFAGTSVADLATALRISKAAVYYHYRSKTDLLHRLVDPLLDAIDACIDAHAIPRETNGTSQDQASTDTVRRLLAAYLAALIAHRPVVALVASDTAVINHPEIGPRIREQNRRLRSMLSAGDPGAPAMLRAEAALGAIWRPLVVDLDVSFTDAAHQQTLIDAAVTVLDPRASSADQGSAS